MTTSNPTDNLAALRLRDELAQQGMSQAELAVRMGRAPSVVNELCRGKLRITAKTAIQLEYCLGISAREWMRLDCEYRLALARQRRLTCPK